MNNAIELDWPTLGPEVAEKIVIHYEQYKHYSKRFKRIQEGKSMVQDDFVIETSGAYQLQKWPEHMNFLEDIFKGHAVNKNFLHCITLQRSINELPPHTDTYRKMSVIYIVEGAADTVFYKQNNTDNLLPARMFEKSELTEVNRYRFDLNKWYLINNSAIHAVDNYTGKRTSLLFDLTNVSEFQNYEDAVVKINDSKILFL
jgi:hypothetical protein